MKGFQAQSMKELLWKTVAFVFLLSILLGSIIFIADGFHGVSRWTYSVYRLAAEIAGIVLAILGGWCFRKANAELLSTNLAKRKKYARGISLMLLIVIAVTLFPELLAYYEGGISNLVERTENQILLILLDRLHASATGLMVAFALSAVFFCRGAFKSQVIDLKAGDFN